jgi:hypothetical protein
MEAYQSGQNLDLQVTLKIVSYGLDPNELVKVKTHVTTLDQLFTKWLDQENSLSGLLNPKLSKQFISELKDKIDRWQNYSHQLKKDKKRSKAIKDKMTEYWL